MNDIVTKKLIVFGHETKLVQGKVGFFDKNAWPVVVADINQYTDVISDPIGYAHLIAAAPELYEMLEELSSQLTDINAHSAVNDIEKLLAKARGEL